MLVIAGVAIVVAAIALWPDARPLPPAGSLGGANVMLVTIDTLRADRVGAYGAAHPTPTLDGIAAAGARFTRAYTHAVMTLPAHASLLTGRIPPGHGVRNNGAFRLRDDEDTLAERLRDAGYRTGAFVGAFVLDRRFGLAQGFDTYDDRIADRAALDFHIAERPAGDVLAAARAWIEGLPAGAPWFAWVHLFDPHTPYRPASPSSGDAYTDEVLLVDRELGAFLQSLRDGGRLERTLLAVTADHGEALGDHGEATHGLFAYDSTLRVPALLAGPGIAPSVIAAPTGLVDLTATLLALVGARDSALDGRSRLTTPDDTSTVYFEALDAHLTRDWAPLTGIVSGPWKYIDLPVPELYNLADDPAEASNRAARDGDRTRALAGLLARRQAEAVPAAGSARAAIDADAAARLRSLGYTASAADAPSGRAYTADDDPKQLVGVHRQFMTSLDRAEGGDTDGALAGLREVIAARPTFAAAYSSAASILMATGRAPDAVDLLREGIRRGAVSVEIERRLAAAFLAAGDPAGAIEVARRRQADAPDVDLLNVVGIALLETGREAEARESFRRALDLSPGAAGIWTNLGLLEIRSGRPAEASAAFRQAVEADPGAVEAWRGLGAAAMGISDARGAVAAWRRAVDLDRSDADTLFNLCVVMADVAPAEALPYVERFLAMPGVAADDRAHVAAIRDRLARTQRAPGAASSPRR